MWGFLTRLTESVLGKRTGGDGGNTTTASAKPLAKETDAELVGDVVNAKAFEAASRAARETHAAMMRVVSIAIDRGVRAATPFLHDSAPGCPAAGSRSARATDDHREELWLALIAALEAFSGYDSGLMSVRLCHALAAPAIDAGAYMRQLQASGIPLRVEGGEDQVLRQCHRLQDADTLTRRDNEVLASAGALELNEVMGGRSYALLPAAGHRRAPGTPVERLSSELRSVSALQRRLGWLHLDLGPDCAVHGRRRTASNSDDASHQHVVRDHTMDAACLFTPLALTTHRLAAHFVDRELLVSRV